jgi:hypothetical protein
VSEIETERGRARVTPQRGHLLGLLVLGIGAAWAGAHSAVVFLVPSALRRMVPLPFDLHVQHLLLLSLDTLAIVTGLTLAGLVAAGAVGSLRERGAKLALALAAAIAVLAFAQRQLIEPKVAAAIITDRISYPAAPPDKEFDELKSRWTTIDVLMIAAGVGVCGATGRRGSRRATTDGSI